MLHCGLKYSIPLFVKGPFVAITNLQKLAAHASIFMLRGMRLRSYTNLIQVISSLFYEDRKDWALSEEKYGEVLIEH